MRPIRFALAFAAALFLSGCLVNQDEFDKARNRKEALTAELAKLRQSNDQLNHEISRLYADREVLSGHVAMTAAAAMHNRLTARVRPASPPSAAAPARPAQAQTPRPPRPAQLPPPPSPPSDGAPRPLPPPPPFRGGAVDWGR